MFPLKTEIVSLEVELQQHHRLHSSHYSICTGNSYLSDQKTSNQNLNISNQKFIVTFNAFKRNGMAKIWINRGIRYLSAYQFIWISHQQLTIFNSGYDWGCQLNTAAFVSVIIWWCRWRRLRQHWITLDCQKKMIYDLLIYSELRSAIHWLHFPSVKYNSNKW